MIPPSVVVDASVALKWVLPETGSDKAAGLRSAELHAPGLIYIECSNALWVRVRGSMLEPAEAGACMNLIEQAPIRAALARDLASSALGLALDLGVTVYDATYLALSRTLSRPLVTADAKLRAAASQVCEIILLEEL